MFAILSGEKIPGICGPIRHAFNGWAILCLPVDKTWYRLVIAHSWKGRLRWRIGGLLLMRYVRIWASVMKPFINGLIRWGSLRIRSAVAGCSSDNRLTIGFNPEMLRSKRRIDSDRRSWEENYPFFRNFISYNGNVQGAELRTIRLPAFWELIEKPLFSALFQYFYWALIFDVKVAWGLLVPCILYLKSDLSLAHSNCFRIDVLVCAGFCLFYSFRNTVL